MLITNGEPDTWRRVSPVPREGVGNLLLYIKKQGAFSLPYGDIIWDSISKLDFYMTDGSTLKGAVKDDESCAGDGGSGYASLYIEEGSSWVVTGDSELTNLYCAGTITDEDGNSVTIKGSDGTVYAEGTSKYTITVDKYEKTADLSGCSQATQWSDYETEKPEQLS